MSSPDLLSNLLCKNLAWWVVIEDFKNHIIVIIGQWALAQGWVLTRAWVLTQGWSLAWDNMEDKESIEDLLLMQCLPIYRGCSGARHFLTPPFN